MVIAQFEIILTCVIVCESQEHPRIQNNLHSEPWTLNWLLSVQKFTFISFRDLLSEYRVQKFCTTLTDNLDHLVTLMEKSSSIGFELEGKIPTILKVIQAKLLVASYYLLTIGSNNEVHDWKYFKAHIANQSAVAKDR